ARYFPAASSAPFCCWPWSVTEEPSSGRTAPFPHSRIPRPRYGHTFSDQNTDGIDQGCCFIMEFMVEQHPLLLSNVLGIGKPPQNSIFPASSSPFIDNPSAGIV